jgi:RNA polymerase sigma-70 factor (ECF subfamily)
VQVELPPADVGADAPDDDTGAGNFAAWAGPSRLAMTRLAARLAPDADPQDVVQDALTRAWLKWHQFDPNRGSPTTWLLAITADQARAARRTRRRWLRLVDDATPLPETPSHDPDPDRDADLDRAIRALPDRQQLAVQLHYFVGLPVDDTARVMGCSPGTVKSTLFDARARLRRLLGDDDD